MKGISSPQISVLLPVYNGATYLQEALASVFAQSFTNFELIALYDASTDGSMEILRGWRDSRLVIFENDKKEGLAAILNKGLELARGEFIARMDSDDLCHPERFSHQMAYLASHPDVAICGTWFRGLTPNGKLNGQAARLETDPRAVHAALFFRSRLGHPTVLMRAEVLREHGLRYDSTAFAEDFDFWVRAMRHCTITNIPEFLLFYRMHPGQLSHHGRSWESTRQIRAGLLAELGLDVDATELELHQQICTSTFQPSEGWLRLADLWLCRIKAANDHCQVYPEPFFSHALMERWVALSFHSVGRLGFRPDLFLRPRLMAATGLGPCYVFRTLLRLLWNKASDLMRGWLLAGRLRRLQKGFKVWCLATSPDLSAPHTKRPILL